MFAKPLNGLEQKSDLVLIRRLERPAKDTKFALKEDFIVGDIRVPAGFETDLASVPRLIRGVVSKIDGIEASVIHDYLYSLKEDRQFADTVFLHLLRDAVPLWKRYSMYYAVRWFGSLVWNRKAR